MSTRLLIQAWPWLAFALIAGARTTEAAASSPMDALAPFEEAQAAAERSLGEGEFQSAESLYRSALLEGWLLMGALKAGEGRMEEAREAFRRASTSAVETRRALEALALAHLQMGEAKEAVSILTGVAGRNPRDVRARRLLAQALAAGGELAESIQELEEARLGAPDDAELAFALASGYLKQKRGDAAEPLFAQVRKARPIPQTHVLIGRTYRDFGVYDRARAELLAALAQDPKVRHAHYYLGTLGVMAEGTARLDDAIVEFGKELQVSPADPLTNLRLGIALVESRRPAEAREPLEIAARAEPPQADAFHFLGRCQLALERPAAAAASLKRALQLTDGARQKDEVQLGSIHYNLALALRATGATDEAAAHFAEAEQSSARVAESARERLSRYMRDAPEPDLATTVALPVDFPLADLDPTARAPLEQRIATALARAYVNLGIMEAQRGRPSPAADFFEQAALIDPTFPQVQYSLGVARFNAQEYAKATGPLAAALASDPANGDLKRMLALACLNTEAYPRAVELLRDDPGRTEDPSLQYAFGLALVRSDRAAEAQVVFSDLLARHGDSAELSVVIGQANAQQGDYDKAIEALTRALQLKAGVEEASATLGVIYLKQGRLAEAEASLRAELKEHPGDLRSQQTLATVLDLEGRSADAIPLLRAVLKAKPDFVDARYLLGKVLLAEGAAAEAVEHLEAAARLAPDDANVHYQLGQAYQKLGRTDDAQREFDAHRSIKDKRRGTTP